MTRARKLCCVDGCDRPSKTRGMCGTHAQRVATYGTTEIPVPPNGTVMMRGNRWVWDPAPVLAIAEVRAGWCEDERGWVSWAPDHAVAVVLGVDRERVHMWRHGRHWMQTNLAERCAQALGLHPSELWGDDYWALAGVSA